MHVLLFEPAQALYSFFLLFFSSETSQTATVIKHSVTFSFLDVQASKKICSYSDEPIKIIIQNAFY